MINDITNNSIFGDDDLHENKVNPNVIDNEKNLNYFISENEEMCNKLNNEGNYTNYLIDGFSDINNHKYNEALLKFEKAYEIANLINDDYKKKESQCQIGITKFMNGDLNAVNLLEQLFNEYNEQMNNIKNYDIDSFHLLLFTKIGSNIILFYFIKNNIDKCLEVMNTMIETIDGQKENSNKLNGIRNIIHILFRYKSLNQNKSIDISDNNNNPNNNLYFINEENENEIIKNSIHNLIQEFNNYLKIKDLEILFKCISLTEEAFKKIEDYNGLIFIIFLEQIIIYNKELDNENLDDLNKSQEKNDAYMKICSLFQAINDDNNFHNLYTEKIDTHIKIFKEKLEASEGIYDTLLEKEKNIIELIENEKNIINNSDEKNNIKIPKQEYYKELLIKILNQTISEIDNIQNNEIKIQINSQLQQTLSIIKNKNIYLSEKIMEPFKKIINNTIKKTFNDKISKIYQRIQKGIYYEILKKNVLSSNQKSNNEKIKQFYNDCYMNIVDGNVLLKLNMGNNGIKEHFYKINFENQQIEVYNKRGEAKPDKSIKFKQIQKMTFGLKSKNFITKMKNIPIMNEPWKGLSFHCKSRSLDLIFKKEDIGKKWFYGIQHILRNINEIYKINSTTGYIIQKLKMKIFKKVNKNQKDVKNSTFLKAILKYCNDNNII